MLTDYRNSKRIPNTLIVLYEQHFVKKRNTPYSIFNTEHEVFDEERCLFYLSCHTTLCSAGTIVRTCALMQVCFSLV